MTKEKRSLEKYILPSEIWLSAFERSRLVRLWNHGIRVFDQCSKTGYIFVERKRKESLIFEGIDKAERGMFHMLDFYFKDFFDEKTRLGEILSVNEIQVTISNLHEKALLGKAIDQFEKELVEQEIARAESVLQNCRNEIKISLYEKFLNLEKFIDSLGRVNPGASAAKLVLMAKQAKMREEDVAGIIKWVGEKKLLLSKEHLLIRSQIQQALNRVQFLYNRPGWIEDSKILASFCNYLEKLLRSAWVLPYRPEVQKVIGLLQNIVERKNEKNSEIKKGIVKSIGNTLEKILTV